MPNVIPSGSVLPLLGAQKGSSGRLLQSVFKLFGLIIDYSIIRQQVPVWQAPIRGFLLQGDVIDVVWIVKKISLPGRTKFVSFSLSVRCALKSSNISFRLGLQQSSDVTCCTIVVTTGRSDKGMSQPSNELTCGRVWPWKYELLASTTLSHRNQNHSILRCPVYGP